MNVVSFGVEPQVAIVPIGGGGHVEPVLSLTLPGWIVVSVEEVPAINGCGGGGRAALMLIGQLPITELLEALGLVSHVFHDAVNPPLVFAVAAAIVVVIDRPQWIEII